MRTRKQALWRRGLRALSGESGATFIEYALLAGLVAIVVAIGAAVFGTKLKTFFENTADQAKNIGTDVKNTKLEGGFGN